MRSQIFERCMYVGAEIGSVLSSAAASFCTGRHWRAIAETLTNLVKGLVPFQDLVALLLVFAALGLSS